MGRGAGPAAGARPRLRPSWFGDGLAFGFALLNLCPPPVHPGTKTMGLQAGLCARCSGSAFSPTFTYFEAQLGWWFAHLCLRETGASLRTVLGLVLRGGALSRRSVNTEQPFIRGSYRWRVSAEQREGFLTLRVTEQKRGLGVKLGSLATGRRSRGCLPSSVDTAPRTLPVDSTVGVSGAPS